MKIKGNKERKKKGNWRKYLQGKHSPKSANEVEFSNAFLAYRRCTRRYSFTFITNKSQESALKKISEIITFNYLMNIKIKSIILWNPKSSLQICFSPHLTARSKFPGMWLWFKDQLEGGRGRSLVCDHPTTYLFPSFSVQ